MTILITLLAYFAVLFAVSRLTAGKGSSNDTFFRAGRRSPWYMVAFGMVGASISGVTFVSVPGMVTKMDMTYLQTCLGFILGYFAVAYILLPLYYRLGLTSIYTYLGQRIGRRAYLTGAWFFLLSKMTGAAVAFYVVCIILQRFVFDGWGLPFPVTVAAMVALIWLYTRRGGIKTLVWTDSLQTLCLFLALLLIIAEVASALGWGLADAAREVWRSDMSRVFVFDDWASKQNFWKQFLSGVFIVIVMTGLDQDKMQKNLTCKTLGEAQKDMCSYGFAFVPANLLFLSLGVLLVLLAQRQGVALPAQGDELLPMFAATGELGTAVVVLFTIGMVAASFSSADSALTSMTTSLCVDIFGRADDERLRHRTHLLVSVVFALCILVFRAVNSTSVIDAIYILVSYTYGPLLGLFAFGMLTRRRTCDRAVPFIAVASPLLCYAIDQLASRLCGYHFGYELLMLNGLLTFAGLWVASLKTKPNMTIKTFLLALALATPTLVHGQGVTIHLAQTDSCKARTLRLTPVADRIVRVEATPESAIPQRRKSLVVVPQTAKVDYQTAETDTSLTLTTRSLAVSVDKRTGLMAYADRLTGRTLLSEAAGSKAFTRYVSPQTALPETYQPSSPGEVNWGKTTGANILSAADRTGYSWRLLFDSPADESFYGLGQHQAEEMDYKGRNEELFQYNTKVSIPFVVSTRGYGLLWDSYSYGRWGNPGAYRQLGQVLRLYDEDGIPGTLSATYTDKQGNLVLRSEDSLYFENSREIKQLPKGFNLDGSNVVYEGYVEADTTCTYHFQLYYAGYVKVWLGFDQVVAERWRTAWNPNTYKFTFRLRKGERVPLRIEWLPDGGVSYLGLRVAEPQADEQQARLSIHSEMSPCMDYYFIAGATMDSVIAGYRQLTGKAQVMPRWALGFWQSRERYKTASQLIGTLAEFRRRRIPIDNIVQDWNYWADDQWGSHAFEPSRYPDPQAMLDSVHALHGRYMISVWPKFYCNTDNYKALDAHGWMYRRAVADSIRDWVGPGYVGSFYDAYSAGARRLFWHQMDSCLYSKYGQGIDAWWMDASEPNVRDCTPIDYRKQLCGPTSLGTSDEYFNAYSIVNADAIYTGQRTANPDRRVFLLTRSGFAGLQRYSTATWSGDIGTRWEDMRAQMTAGLNFSMAGVPFWGMDIGGFCVEGRYVKAQKLYDKTGEENADLREWRELQARWHQFGCFVPLFRTHGQWPAREVWNIAPEGHPAYESIVYYDRLRYRLLPYLYSLAGWVHFRDYTLMRGLAMDFASDPTVRPIGDQWMLGPALMACPVTHYGARTREVYFPKPSGWYDLYTGSRIEGGRRLTVDAPYGRMPVYVREGSILPTGPTLQWTDERPADTLTLYIYAGADGQFQLYEDDGLSYDYEKGRFATIDFTYTDATRSLTISPRRGKFEGMLRRRTFNVVLVTGQSPVPTADFSATGKVVAYKGKKVEVEL